MTEHGDLINADAVYSHILLNVPAIEPKRKTGKWIDTGSGQECDQCHEIQYGYDSNRNFCANCGADMRGEK